MKKKKLSKIITFFIVVAQAGAMIAPAFCIPVYAGVKATVAGYLLSLLASINIGITDTATLSAIQTNLGSMYIESVTQAEITAGLSGINSKIVESLATTATQAATYSQEIGVAVESAQAASGATNLYTSIQNYLGTGVMQPAVGGISLASVGQGLLAVAAGVGLGIMVDNARTQLQNTIGKGLAMNRTDYAGDGYIATYVWDSINPKDSPYYYRAPTSQGFTGYGIINGKYHFIVVNQSESSFKTALFRRYGSASTTYTYVNPHSYFVSSTDYPPLWGGYDFGIGGSAEELVSPYLNTGVNPIYSPDIIGNNGNQRNIGGEAVNIKPTYNPEEETPQPIDIDDYNRWAQDARDNTDNGDTGQEQGDRFKEMLDDVIEPVPVIPGVPTIPTNPLPVYPDQPVVPQEPMEPNPQIEVTPIPTPSPDIQSEVLQGSVKGLEDIFPFCIPFDIRDMLKMFKASRKAPCISGTIPLGDFYTWEVEIDMSRFDSVAAVLRTLELIIFIIGLAIVTKDLIKV